MFILNYNYWHTSQIYYHNIEHFIFTKNTKKRKRILLSKPYESENVCMSDETKAVWTLQMSTPLALETQCPLTLQL